MPLLTEKLHLIVAVCVTDKVPQVSIYLVHRLWKDLKTK